MQQPRLLVFCTVSTGLDAIAEVLRSGFFISAIVGVAPRVANPEIISGYVDISAFAKKWKIRFIHVNRYDLSKVGDKKKLTKVDFDLIWVAGWQRLIPSWLIEKAPMGVLGGHGSPDGIRGGRGRSPQNWAIMLGCSRFDLALFKITPRVDDGDVILQRSFYYNNFDDINISYKKAALCMGEMVSEVLRNPNLLNKAQPQLGKAFYYPQRKPEDGYADWNLPCGAIWSHCRALTRPYPGLRTKTKQGTEITIWRCQPFDKKKNKKIGVITKIFADGTFLVSCRDGRIIILEYQILNNTKIFVNTKLISTNYETTMKKIINRHNKKNSNQKVAARILKMLE